MLMFAFIILGVLAVAGLIWAAKYFSRRDDGPQEPPADTMGNPVSGSQNILTIMDVLKMNGSLVAVGMVDSGIIRKGDVLTLRRNRGDQALKQVTVTDIQMAGKPVTEAKAGEQADIAVSGLVKEEVTIGDVLTSN
ncbi:MAG: EF-Tu/IF-2/RF-3 family GTPase [Bacteroidota bacterium]